MGSGNKFQRQKKGPLELRGEEGKGNASAGKRRMGKAWAYSPRGEHTGSSILRAFKGGDFRGRPESP